MLTLSSFLARFLGLLTIPMAAAAQTLIIPTSADATADQSQPTLNFGSAMELGFGKNFTNTPSFASWPMRAHLQFDMVPILQTGRWPTRVMLRWYQNRASAAGCLDISVHKITVPWNENTLNWQNRPAHEASAIARSCVGDSAGIGWKQAEVTTLVHQWLLGSAPNFGLVLRDPSESSAGAARPGFAHSREGSNPALVPQLEVEFAERFGFGCSNRALLPMSDVTAGRPRLGETFTVSTTGLIGGSWVGMLFGLSNSNWSGGALPASLAPYGFPFCELYVSPDANISLPSVPGNHWDFVMQLPASAALDGTRLYFQAFALPPLAQLGLEVGHGLGVTVRR